MSSASKISRRNRLKWSDLLELSLSSLGANLLRSSLTILGVSIGVFSVVGVMTALSAIRQSIDTSLSMFGANVLQIVRDPPLQIHGGPHDRWRNRRPPVTPRQADEFKAMMDELGIPTTLSATDTNERVAYRDKITSPRIRIVGTNENYLVTNKYDLDFGRMLSPADVEFNRPVTVIGYEILDELFPHENPLDKVVNLDGERYTIVGVLKERGENFGQSTDNLALVPVSKFVENNWHRRRTMDIAIQAPSAEELDATQDLATGYMRIVRALPPEKENDFEITSNQSLQSAFAQIAFMAGLAGLLVSGIALVCAGIGIMNIMLVSVTERTREIGIRKALGARKRNILMQFLLEAIFLSEAGAAIGIALGMLAGNFAAAQLNAEMIIPWVWIGAAVAVCSLIGIGFGFAPALRAANLRPVDALRAE